MENVIEKNEINNIIKIPVGRKYQLLVKNKYQNYQNRNF